MPVETKVEDVKKTDATDKTEEKPEAKFDRERQRADQAEANWRKERQERERVSGELTDLRMTAERLQAQIAELTKARKASESDDLPEVPDDASIEDLLAVTKATGKVIRNLREQLADLKTSTAKHQEETRAEREQREAEERRNATLEKVCTRLEKKHGTGLRNRAIQMMESRIDKGDKPADPAEAALMLDDCFMEAKQEREDKKKQEGPAGDSGGGGTRPKLGPGKIKPGSLAEVAAQFAGAAGTG